MSNSALIGALRVEFSADTSEFIEGNQKVRAEATKTEGKLKNAFGNIGAFVKGGIAGFVGGISIGLLTAVVKNSLALAASIKDVAIEAGTTTTRLQELRYAAQQNGIEASEVDGALTKLRVTLGRVAAGADRPTKALAAIGIAAKDLQGLDTADAFRLIADAMAEIPDPAERAAVQTDLFGEAGARLDAILYGGAGAIDTYAAAAHNLGIILTEEQINKASEAKDKFEALSTMLETKVTGAVADNADMVIWLGDAFANAIGGVASFIGEIRTLSDELTISYNKMAAQIAITKELRQQAAKRAAEAEQRLEDRRTPKARTPKPRPRAPARIPQYQAPAAPRARAAAAPRSRGGGRRGPSAEQLAQRAERERQQKLRDENQFAQELLRGEQDILRARQSLMHSTTERAAIDRQLLDLENQSVEAQLAYEVAANDITQAQADQLLAQHRMRQALERQALDEEERYEASREETELALERGEIALDLLAAEGQLAETAAEQRDVQLRMLDLYYRQERARLEAVLADERASNYAKEEARLRLAALSQRQRIDEAGVIQSTRGPQEEYLAGLPTTAAKWTEALEEVRVRGFEALEDSIVDVMMGVDNLGDAFRKLVKQILADLIRLTIQRQIIAPLANSMFGGGGAGIPGFAMGTNFAPGGFAIVGERGPEVVNLPKGAQVFTNEQSRGMMGGVTMNIATPSADSFMRSERQIVRSMRRRMA